MFTGIVHERGRLLGDPVASGQGGVELSLALSAGLAGRLEPGASLAIDGVCLTVTEVEAQDSRIGRVKVELSPETLRRTTLGRLTDGSETNLEPALAVGEAMGGHWVQGHVDGTVPVVERRDLTDHRELAFELPTRFAPYLVEKGSVTLDGVSLTVSSLGTDRFEVALIPHTLEMTNLGRLSPGDSVNLEIDVLAKYVERAVAVHLSRSSG